jgi:hypothetical protein
VRVIKVFAIHHTRLEYDSSIPDDPKARISVTRSHWCSHTCPSLFTYDTAQDAAISRAAPLLHLRTTPTASRATGVSSCACGCMGCVATRTRQTRMCIHTMSWCLNDTSGGACACGTAAVRVAEVPAAEARAAVLEDPMVLAPESHMPFHTCHFSPHTHTHSLSTHACTHTHTHTYIHTHEQTT